MKHEGPVIDSVDGVNIIACEHCQFRHVDPLPTIEELKEFYRHDFYEKDKPLSIPHKIEDQEWLNLQYSDRYDTFEQFNHSKNLRILDIGSGAGFFLKHGLERGWTVLGLEPAAQAAKYAREQGIEVIEDIFCEEVVGSLGEFDVVHASLVLEHVPDPIQIIKTAYRITKPGGIICISTPNDYNPFQHALRKVDQYPPWWVCPNHHLNYFSPESLKQLIERCGYIHFHSESSFPIDLFLLMGDNYVGNSELGRSCHKKRIRFEKTLELAGLNSVKRQLYQSLADLNLGREICIYGRKN